MSDPSTATRRRGRSTTTTQPNDGNIFEYGSGYGFVCGEYGFLVFAPLGRGEDFKYVDCFACFGCGQVNMSVVSEFGVKCESQYFLGVWSWVVLCCLSEVPSCVLYSAGSGVNSVQVVLSVLSMSCR